MQPQNMNKPKVIIYKIIIFYCRVQRIQDIKLHYAKNSQQNKGVHMEINVNLLMEHKN
jgi:hypothetical protein